jgi:hypothetical protein
LTQWLMQKQHDERAHAGEGDRAHFRTECVTKE